MEKRRPCDDNERFKKDEIKDEIETNLGGPQDLHLR
jgi:hypothetical protein